MDKIEFGKFLSELRNTKNLTQEQLSEKLNVSSKTISKWECGTSLPDLETLCEIAKIFDVSLYELTIYKRIKNPFISKKDILKIINKNSIKKIVFLKISVIILFLLTLIAMIFASIYAIGNYNQIQVYDLVSEDKNFYVEGILIKTKNTYSLSISNIDYLKNTENFSKEKISQIEYQLNFNDDIFERNKIEFKNKTSILNAIESINMHISNKQIFNNVQHLNIDIIYMNSKHEKEIISFKIKPIKNFTNNKLFG